MRRVQCAMPVRRATAGVVKIFISMPGCCGVEGATEKAWWDGGMARENKNKRWGWDGGAQTFTTEASCAWAGVRDASDPLSIAQPGCRRLGTEKRETQARKRFEQEWDWKLLLLLLLCFVWDPSRTVVTEDGPGTWKEGKRGTSCELQAGLAAVLPRD
jgi:hypothetical protein